jgi:hypothetical protein
MDVLDYLYVNGEKVQKPLPEREVKTDVAGYYKTPVGSVICKDDEGLSAYKKQKAKNAQLNNMKNDIDQLKSDMSEIKELLKGLVK